MTSKPTFFKPLLALDGQVRSAMEDSRALVSRVRAVNSPDLVELERSLIDATAALLDALQLVTRAREQEKTFRTGKGDDQ